MAALTTKEKIEKKIADSINALLRKEHLSFEDYQMLSAELGRLNAEEKSKKWEEEAEERKAAMAQLMAGTFGFGGAV